LKRWEEGALMSTPTPPATFPLRHQGVPPADSRYPPAGPGASAPQPAGRPPTVDATKGLHPLPSCRPAGHGLQGTLYQCPECDTRYLAEQWSPDCPRPCRRFGAGGIRPSCEEMITVEKLATDAVASSPLPFTNRRPTDPSIIEEASTIRGKAQVRLDI